MTADDSQAQMTQTLGFFSEMADVLPLVLFAALAVAFAVPELQDSVGFVVLLPFVLALVLTGGKRYC